MNQNNFNHIDISLMILNRKIMTQLGKHMKYYRTIKSLRRNNNS